MRIGEALLGLFKNTEFPEAACTIPDKTEEGVKHAPHTELYLCLRADPNSPYTCTIEYLIPYTAKSEETGKTKFGWRDPSAYRYVDHCTRSVHLDDERVVAWQKVSSKPAFAPPFWEDEDEDEGEDEDE